MDLLTILDQKWDFFSILDIYNDLNTIDNTNEYESTNSIGYVFFFNCR